MYNTQRVQRAIKKISRVWRHRMMTDGRDALSDKVAFEQP